MTTTTTRKHRHEMQPYGWVEMTDCVVETRTTIETRYDNGGQRQREVTRTYVRGTVTDSSYCGALLCGVPIAKATSDRYPVGSTYECRIKHDSDLERGLTVDVAM